MTNEQKLKLVNAIKSNHINYIVELLTEDSLNWRTTLIEKGLPAIHLASMCGRLNIVQLMLEKDSGLLNLKDRSNQTPILVAAMYGHEDLVDYLATQGADLNTPTHDFTIYDGYTAIHWAVKNKHANVAQCLIKHGADINILTEQSTHLIHNASEMGNINLVKILLNMQPKLLDLTDAFGRTPISKAARAGQLRVVDYLAKEGADLCIAERDWLRDTHPKLPIHQAAESGSHQVMQSLINHGADIDVRFSKDKLHVIHIAAKDGHLDLVNMLLDIDPNLLNLPNALNQTIVSLAITKLNLPLVDYLVKRGADLRIATNDPDKFCHGFLPIHYAIQNSVVNYARFLLSNRKSEAHDPIFTKQLDIFRYLIQCDSHSEIVLGADQYSLIHIVSLSDNLEMVKILLDKNPDYLEYTDSLGQTPIALAVDCGHTKIVKYLISKGANLNKETLLRQAINKHHFDVVDVLISHWTEGQHKKHILPYIIDGLQALELMKREPSLINLLLADQRIHKLIEEKKECHINEHTVSWYERPGRRASFFTCINKQAETVSTFKPVQNLGQGTFGLVRLFQNAQGENIAVKSPINIKNNGNTSIETRLEATFNRLAYPDDKSPEIFDFHYNEDEQEKYTNRYVMPFVKGEQPNILVPKIKDTYQLAQLVFEMALELQRIHTIGILHGDIYKKNILIHQADNKYIVRFIDFGLSVFLTADSVTTWDFREKNCKWYPPEKYVTHSATILKPDTSQDVYSLGFLLKKELTQHSRYQQLIQSFPSILTFITDSQKIAPLDRPSLTIFCEQLQNDLSATETLSDVDTLVCSNTL